MSTIWIDDTFAGEGDGVAVFTLRRIGPTDRTDSVQFRTVQHFAGPGADYVARQSTVTFAPGETVKTVEIQLVNDGADEFNEAFELELFNPGSGTTIGRSSAYAAIIDNDAPAGTPYIRAIDAVVNEVEGRAVVWFALDRPASTALGIDYATVDGDAIAGSDYVAAGGTLSFAPGEMVKAVTIDLLHDRAAERSESLYVTLANPTGAAIAGAGSAEIRVFDSDGSGADVPLAFVDATHDESEAIFRAFVYMNGVAFLSTLFTLQFAAATALAFSSFSPAIMRLAAAELLLAGWRVFPFSFALGDDALPNPMRTMLVQLTATLYKEVFSRFTVQAITDDDGRVPVPVVSIGDALGSEGRTKNPTSIFENTIEFTVSLNAPTDHEVSVPWSTADWTAENGSDFFALGGTVTFAPGETVKQVRVPILNDRVAEFTEQFTASLGTPSGATLGRSTAIGTIADDDPRLPAIETRWVLSSDRIVGENDAWARLYLAGCMPCDELAAFDLALTLGTAGSQDFVYYTNTVSIAQGLYWVDLPIRPDTVAEPAKSARLTFTSTDASFARSSATLTLLDDDATGPTRYYAFDARASEALGVFELTVARSGDASQAGSVELSFGSRGAVIGASATPATGDDLSPPPDHVVRFLPHEVVRNLAFVVLDDALAEGDEMIDVRLLNPQGGSIGDGYARITIAASDLPPVPAMPGVFVIPETVGESSPFVDVEIRLTAPTLATVSVDWAAVAATATASDFLPSSGTVQFMPGEQSVTVRIPILDNTAVEPVETFTLQLSNPVDAALAGGAALVTIVDNDAAPGTPAITIADASADEHAGLLRFVVSLDRRSDEAVTVDFATANGSALAGADYTGIDGTLWFAPGQTAKTIWVPIGADTVFEGDETHTVALANPQGATLARAVATGTIVDDDPAPPPPITGTDGDDSLEGTAGDDQIDALAGRDTVEGLAGDDSLDGGDGTDAAVFAVARAAATLAREGDAVRVTAPGLGSDLAAQVERLKFDDTTIAVDTRDFGDNVFDVVAMFYGAFGTMPAADDLARFLPALDADPDKGVADVAQAMLEYYVPGGVPNDALVAHLYLHIFGVPGPASEIALYAGLIGTEFFPDQAALCAAAAALPQNTVKFTALIADGVDLGAQWVI